MGKWIVILSSIAILITGWYYSIQYLHDKHDKVIFAYSFNGDMIKCKYNNYDMLMCRDFRNGLTRPLNEKYL